MTTTVRTLAVLAALVGAAGCASNHGSVEIFALCAPPDAASCGEDGACTAYLASPRPYFYTAWQDSGGLAHANELQMFVQINNQMPQNGDVTSGRVNTNDFSIDTYRLSFTAPGVSLPEMDYPASGTVPANGIASPVIPLIPYPIAAALAAGLSAQGITGAVPASVTVHVKVKGHLEDGSAYETAEHDFAVDVYNDTFLGYPCPLGKVVTGVCPNVGQTSTWTCG